MNILIDFIPFQHPRGVGGAFSFAKAVYDRLLYVANGKHSFWGIYDSRKGVAQQYDLHSYAESHRVVLLDISRISVSEMVRQKKISVLFIAFGQFYKNYDLSDITCKTIMFIHDIFDIERCNNRVDMCICDDEVESRWKRMKRMANVVTGRYGRQASDTYNRVMPLYSSENTIAYTVSDYTANALKYYFPELRKVRVCYSPLRKVPLSGNIGNEALKRLIVDGKPYLFMVSANRIYKNAAILSQVYKQLCRHGYEVRLLTLKYGKIIGPLHTDLDFLTDYEMEQAYKHALALVYPSFFEGFGYPPIEALEHGTPTIASNVTSIPEILGDAGVYFSPFYPADLFSAICRVLDNPDLKKNEITIRKKEIEKRQEKDLRLLINEILSDQTNNK